MTNHDLEQHLQNTMHIRGENCAKIIIDGTSMHNSRSQIIVEKLQLKHKR